MREDVRCHNHLKVGGSRITIKDLVFTEADFCWELVHLAKKYTKGCVPEFVKALTQDALKTTFKGELEEDVKRIMDAKAELDAQRAQAKEIASESHGGNPSPVWDNESGHSDGATDVLPEATPNTSSDSNLLVHDLGV